jgi:hypothetical protein
MTQGAQVIQIAAGLVSDRMTDAEYDLERERIRSTYGDSTSEAGVRFEQELARLFTKCGWSQEQIAAKENMSQQWVAGRKILPVGVI